MRWVDKEMRGLGMWKAAEDGDRKAAEDGDRKAAEDGGGKTGRR